MTAAASWLEATVPTAISPALTSQSTVYETRRFRVLPLNSTRSSKAKDPNAAKRPTCGFEDTARATAKTVGMTMAARTDRFTTRSCGSFDLIQRAIAREGSPEVVTGGAAAFVIRVPAIFPKPGDPGKRPDPGSTRTLPSRPALLKREQPAIMSAAMSASAVWSFDRGA
jgi:hypothetical protein